MKPDYINKKIRNISDEELKEALRKVNEEHRQAKAQAEADGWPATMGDLRRLEERISLLIQGKP
jgi:ribosomal protein L29